MSKSIYCCNFQCWGIISQQKPNLLSKRKNAVSRLCLSVYNSQVYNAIVFIKTKKCNCALSKRIKAHDGPRVKGCLCLKQAPFGLLAVPSSHDSSRVAALTEIFLQTRRTSFRLLVRVVKEMRVRHCHSDEPMISKWLLYHRFPTSTSPKLQGLWSKPDWPPRPEYALREF